MSDRAGEVHQFIRRRIEKKAKLPADCDPERYDYIKAGHIDSIGIIKFVVEIESEFDIIITEEELSSAQFRTLGGLTALVLSKLA